MLLLLHCLGCFFNLMVFFIFLFSNISQWWVNVWSPWQCRFSSYRDLRLCNSLRASNLPKFPPKKLSFADGLSHHAQVSLQHYWVFIKYMSRWNSLMMMMMMIILPDMVMCICHNYTSCWVMLTLGARLEVFLC